jgi:phosphohistidine swiveling domain-containing protein
MEKKLEFIADKASGFEGCIFALSVTATVAEWTGRRNRFRFPFYAISIRSVEEKSDEWIDEKRYAAVSDAVLSHVTEHGVGSFVEVRETIEREADILFEKSADCLRGMEDLSDTELSARFVDFMNAYVFSYGLGAVTYLYESTLSERLTISLGARYGNATEMLGTLLHSSYRSFMLESEEALVGIRNESDSTVQEILAREYIGKYFYIKANYASAPVLDVAQVLDMAAKSGEHHQDTTVEIRPVSDVQLTKEEEGIIALFKETEVIRDQRKRINLIGSYTMFRFLEEVCRRTGTEYSLGKRMFWYELPELLRNPNLLVQELRERNVATCVYDGHTLFNLDYDAIRSRETVDDSVRELKGTPAAKGKVTGSVRIVLGSKDFEKFQAGEILVAEMTRPDFVPLIQRSLAVITDEGGLTCHAAIVAREMKKPCIIGMKVATQVLHDGDLVEVDADSGSVRILERNGDH